MTMQFKGYHFASGKDGRRSTMRWGPEPRKPLFVPPFGTELFVGPKGAGKTLLAMHRARKFYEGKRRLPDGRCLCGESDCDSKWQVYTNLESPTLPEFGAWATTLDLAGDMVDAESNLFHVLILVDEITQMFNSRRSMMSEVVNMIHRVTLIRKNLVMLWGTGISFDWIDVRIRDQASMLYNCWTPNQGRTVWANVHQLANGHLPPHMRRTRPLTKWWPTEITKKFYWHRETINFTAELQALRTEPAVFVKARDGSTKEMTFSEILADELVPLIQAGTEYITTDEVIEIISARYNLTMGKPYVRDFLIGSGFQNDNGTFKIMTKGPEDEYSIGGGLAS